MNNHLRDIQVGQLNICDLANLGILLISVSSVQARMKESMADMSNTPFYPNISKEALTIPNTNIHKVS